MHVSLSSEMRKTFNSFSFYFLNFLCKAKIEIQEDTLSCIFLESAYFCRRDWGNSLQKASNLLELYLDGQLHFFSCGCQFRKWYCFRISSVNFCIHLTTIGAFCSVDKFPKS